VVRLLLLVLVQMPLAALVTAVLTTTALVIGPADREGRLCRGLSRSWARVLLALARVQVTVEGAGHAPARAAVYAANHGSALDILVVFAHLPVDFRIVHKRSLYRVPFLGWGLWLSRHIGIDRRNPFRARRSLDEAARRIREGTNVFVFPEGTRTPGREVGRFKRGSFSLALEAGAPVVPVSLVGIRDVVPQTLFSLRPGRVRLLLHDTVSVEGRALDEADALAEEVRSIVVAGCARA
jgi:1-acyl-sn-glycerol-3-phosphate acyltransferase